MSQSLYSKGIYTGFALVCEMIERKDVSSLQVLNEILRDNCRKNIDERHNLVMSHAGEMLQVLNRTKNVEKGGWQDMTPGELLDLAKAELEEFHTALWTHHVEGNNIANIRAEAADVSNYIAMAVDVAERSYHAKG